MAQSPLRLIKQCTEYRSKDRISDLPKRIRGIYVLYLKDSDPDKYVVQYVGMAAAGRGAGLRRRLHSHANSTTKGNLWTHFSAFEVWDNIRDEEVAELEGLFDTSTANRRVASMFIGDSRNCHAFARTT
jgi:hypothetical protein